jgi:hypothetical protein
VRFRLLPSLLGATCISHLTTFFSSAALTLGGSNRNLIAMGSRSSRIHLASFSESLEVEISACRPCSNLYQLSAGFLAQVEYI